MEPFPLPLKLPLRVVVTRPVEQAQPWLDGLRTAGLDAVSLPLIAIAPMADTRPLHQAWQQLHRFGAVMFVSANAVDHFFACRPGPASDHAITNEATNAATNANAFTPNATGPTRAWVTGAGSVAALLRRGADPDRIDAPAADAGQWDSEALWQTVAAQVRPGLRVLLVRGGQGQAPDHVPEQAADQAPGQGARVEPGGGSDASRAEAGRGAGRDWLAGRLQQAGAQVEFVVAYQRMAPVWNQHALGLLRQAASDGSVWLFSSAEALAHLAAANPALHWGQARAVATHPRIALAARKLGFSVVLESRPVLSAIVASIESLA